MTGNGGDTAAVTRATAPTQIKPPPPRGGFVVSSAGSSRHFIAHEPNVKA